MTSQRDYRLELRQSSAFAGVSSILVKSSIISGINPEQRIYDNYILYMQSTSQTPCPCGVALMAH